MINRVVKLLLTPYVKYLRYIKSNTNFSLYETLYERSLIDSADYVERHLKKAMFFPMHKKLWDFTLAKVCVEGIFAEFGVFEGVSINHFSAKLPKVQFFGFDSFEGLKEDWQGTQHQAGMFNLNGLEPQVNKNVTLVKGWFDDSLPKFLSKTKKNFAFIHLDADTYESTRLLLNLLSSRIAVGTVIIFDEYIGFPGWRFGEYLAWQEFVKEHKVKYIAFSNQQAAIKVC